MSQWILGEAEFALVPHRTMEFVLIEYDGPQLAIFKDAAKQRYVGLYAHGEGTTDRWIHAPISRLELEALCTEGIPMRNAICKSPVDIIEYVNGRPRCSWTVEPSSIPPALLPVPGAFLPKIIGRAAMARLKLKIRTTSVNEKLLRLDGRVVQNNRISFAGMSAVTQAFQGLWSAMSDATLPPLSSFTPETLAERERATTLSIAATPKGSFGIEVSTSNDEVFSVIAQYYKKLLALAPDVQTSDVEHIPTQILNAYANYLKILESHGIEVITNWQSDVTFIGYNYARSTRVVIDEVRKKKPTPKDSKQDGKVVMKGFFERWGFTDKKFAFFDLATSQSITGKIDGRFARTQRDGEVSVGSKTHYNIELNIKDDSYTLTNMVKSQMSIFDVKS